MKRESFTVIFHSNCIPARDAYGMAEIILKWWNPDVEAVERAIMLSRWKDSLYPMFKQCARDGTDMEIHVSMHGADPSLRIVRIFKPDHHLLPKRPT